MAKVYCPATLSRRTFTLSGFAAAASAKLMAQTQGSFLYDALDLGIVPPYSSINALGINRRGQVVGNLGGSSHSSGEGFFWKPGGSDGPAQIRALGTLSGQPAWWDNGSQAYAINNSGYIVGIADGTGKLVDSPHACIWQPDGKVIDLGTMGEGMISMARGINDTGSIVGWSETRLGTIPHFKHEHAFICDIRTRQLRDLGVDQSEANSVNDWNEIAGWYVTDEGRYKHALYWDASGRAFDLHSRVSTGGYWSEAAAINNRGQVVGWAAGPDGRDRGFVWDARTGRVKHVPWNVHNQIYAINNVGFAVGKFQSGTTDVALLWNVDTGEAEDLNERLPPDQRMPKVSWPPAESGWALWKAWGINDAYQIVGTGLHVMQRQGSQRAFRLTPRLSVPR